MTKKPEIVKGDDLIQMKDGDLCLYYKKEQLTVVKLRENTHVPFTGVGEDHHDNGQLAKRVNYKNGLLDGLSESYDGEGNLREKRTYKDGEHDGLWESFRDVGQLSFKRNFKNGVMRYEEKYYKNGQLKHKFNFNKDGEHDGLCENYHENGKVSTKANIKNGQRHGVCEHTHFYGELSERARLYLQRGENEVMGYLKQHYKNGLLHGPEESFDKEGNLERTKTYKDGKLVKSIRLMEK